MNTAIWYTFGVTLSRLWKAEGSVSVYMGVSWDPQEYVKETERNSKWYIHVL